MYSTNSHAQDIPPPLTWQQAQALTVDVYPQVVINGYSHPKSVRFIQKAGSLYITPAALQQLDIHIPANALQNVQWLPESADAAATPLQHTQSDAAASAQAQETTADDANAIPQALLQRWFVVASVPKLQVQFDAAAQKLNLIAPLAWLRLPKNVLGKKNEPAWQVAQSDVALVLNYDASVSGATGSQTNAAMHTDWRLTTPLGYLSHSHLFRTVPKTSGNAPKQRFHRRLDTYWRSTFPKYGMALTIGDISTSQLNFGGGTRLGGIRLEKSYSLQPWRSTVPLKRHVGSSTLPATIDLYIDGVRQSSEKVAAGAYELLLPTRSSTTGRARVVVTDMLGRSTVQDVPLYTGSNLLAQGLAEWSLEAGFVRTDYAQKDFAYDKQPVISGTLRYGLTNWLTTQAHAEAAKGYHQWALGANASLGVLGQINGSYTQTDLDGKRGKQMAVAYSKSWRGFSVGLAHNRSSGWFSGLASITQPKNIRAQNLNRPAQKQHTSAISLGWGNNRWGNWSANYARTQTHQNPAQGNISLNWSKNIGKRASVFVGVGQTTGSNRQLNAQADLSISLSDRINTGLSGNYTKATGAKATTSYQIDIRRSAGNDSNWGWGLSAQYPSRSFGAAAQYSSQYGDASLQANWQAQRTQQPSSTSWNTSWRGGLIVMQGGVFASKTVNDSFAVVSTNGMANVPIKINNNTIGNTNRSGLLLVPNLGSYQRNKIGIDTLNLPANVQIPHTYQHIVPADKAGVAVQFNITQARSGTFTIVDTQGEPLPVGSTVLNTQGKPVSVIGFEGQTYTDKLPEVTQGSRVRWKIVQPENKRTCYIRLPVINTDITAWIPDYGRLTCEP